MKKNSLNTAVVALLATGLVVLGVAAPANAETVEPTPTPDVSNTAVEEPGLGAEEELPAEVPTPVEEAPAPAEETPAPPVEEEGPAEEAPEVPVVEAPAVPVVTISDIGINSVTIEIVAPSEGGQVNGYNVNVYNADRSIDLVEVANAPRAFTFNNLPANTKFSVDISAVGPGGNANNSTSFTTADAPVAAPEEPSITLVEAGSNFITVKIADGGTAAPNPNYPTSYKVAITLGDDVEVVTLAAPGNHTFTGLTPQTEYIVSAVASNVAGSSSAASAQIATTDEKPVEIPGATTIGGITVKADGAVIPVTVAAGGPVDSVSVTVTAQGADSGITKTAETAGNFTFSGLKSGLYAVSAEAKGPGGTSGVSGFYFFVPEAPENVTASVRDAGTDYIIGAINSGVKNPTVNGPMALAPLSYTVTITGGGIEKVYETTDNGTETGGRFYFGDLKADTAYTITVVATNVAGSKTVKLETSTLKVTEEPVTPVAPAPETLVDDNRGGIDAPASTEAGATVTVQLDKALAGQTVHGWLFSTPTDLGEAVVNADGTVNFTIPNGVPAGAHRLAVMSVNNVLIGWDNIQVTAVDNGETPVTSTSGTDNGAVTTRGTAPAAGGELAQTGGSGLGDTLLWGTLLTLAGVALLVRRKVVANAA